MAKDLEISYLLDFYGNVLTEKQRDIMEQYYNADYSLSEIAENFGISRQGVRDAIKRSEGVMLEMEEKIGYAGRFRVMRKKLDQLTGLARGAKFDVSGAYADVNDLNHKLDAMLALLAEMQSAEE